MEAFDKESVGSDMGFAVPNSQLVVKYGDITVSPGVVLTPTQVKDRPVLDWDADNSAYYAVFMNDPDAPSRAEPKFREWHHWLVANIPGKDISKGEILSDYVGAGPPQDTGLHRYVLLVYKQTGKQDFSSEPHLTNRSGDGRASQSAAKTAAKHGFEGPIAANFFQAEFDDYVPKLYEQLSGK
eukprot:GHVU01167208.1.p1 GENE.GHVU01167208.1~~GHVU01167208.1.p1  ORF type:complete len:183 (-),score=24.27 GHVU01167208.1:382-930(-)